MPVTAVSLFSGCGGFDLGVERAGIDVLWANDVNSHAATTYQRYFPQVTFVQSDVRTLAMEQLPQADLLIGCYPCQGFSVGARRRYRDHTTRDYFADARNYLYQEFIRAIPHVRPRAIVIENVTGLQSSVNGFFFTAQQQALEAAGYRVYAQALNAKDYGVPQSRKRIFIVGIHQDLDLTYKFPVPTHGPKGTQAYVTQQEALAHLPAWPDGEFEQTSFHGHFLTRNRKRPWDSYSYTIVAHSDHVPLHPMGAPMQKVDTDQWILQGEHNRRLSWRECAVLQSFPETFEPAGSLTAKYLQIGNAVPPALAEQIVRPLAQYLRGT